MYTSITQIIAIAILALPLVSAFEGAAPTDLERRYVVRPTIQKYTKLHN